MLSFTPFKSKSFISISSLVVSTKQKRYISVLQTTRKDVYYRVQHKIHREERENRKILSAVTYNDCKQWYKNGERHRDDRDENGRVLPAYIESNRIQAWWKNNKLHRDERDEKGRLLPTVIYNDGTQGW